MSQIQTKQVVFKASKLATIQDIMKIAEDELGARSPLIHIKETDEDVLSNSDLVTIKARSFEFKDLTVKSPTNG